MYVWMYVCMDECNYFYLLTMLLYFTIILLAFNVCVIKKPVLIQGMPWPTSDLIASAAAYPLQYQSVYSNIVMFTAVQRLWNLYL
jgi:hypothetical protein